jgi:hypothetical protein
VPLSYNPQEPMPHQVKSWTCSACSLAWLNRALYIDHATDEYSAVEYIGNPHNINSTYGLMDGSGGRLVQCLREQGAPAFNGWFDYDTAYALAQDWPLLIGGANWYHWVGVRGSGQGLLSLANSAPGWCGVDQELNSQQWYELGPFAVVAVPLLTAFPPPNPA